MKQQINIADIYAIEYYEHLTNMTNWSKSIEFIEILKEMYQQINETYLELDKNMLEQIKKKLNELLLNSKKN